MMRLSFVAAWCLTACVAGGDPKTNSEEDDRLALVEHSLAQVNENSARLQSRLNAVFESTKLLPRYSLRCPEPWHDAGALGEALWGCRAPGPLADGFWPNCNLAASPVEAGLDAKRYFQAAMQRSPALAAAKRLSEREIIVHGNAAYQATYTHQITPKTLQVVATTWLRDQHAFALTCTVPPANFGEVERAVERGLVSESTAGNSMPKQLWVLDDSGQVFEAMYGGTTAGCYHGYPIRRSNPLFDQIARAWRRG